MLTYVSIKVNAASMVTLTAMYAAQPVLVLAFESTRRPEMPKSQSFMLPLSSSKMFDGFTSVQNM